MFAELRDESRIAVHLRAEIEAVSQLLRHGDHVDVDFLMGLGEAGSLLVLAHPFIHRLDEGRLLIGRHIAGQLVAPVIDVMEGERLPVRLCGLIRITQISSGTSSSRVPLTN